MSDHDPQAFIAALTTFETTGELDGLLELYAPDSTSQNLAGADALSGPEGARQLWEADGRLFESVRSEFHNVVSGAEASALEWTRTGTGAGGGPVHYSGVTILEFSDAKITRFVGYFDPAALGAQSLGSGQAENG